MGFRVERYDHVAIYVTDLQRARAFYGGVLGLREVSRPESFDFPGAWYDLSPGTFHLLVERERQPDHPRHFCLWVSDVRAAAEAIAKAGFPADWSTKHKIIGVDRFFTRDPDGNRIEIQGSDGTSTG